MRTSSLGASFILTVRRTPYDAEFIEDQPAAGGVDGDPLEACRSAAAPA